MEISKVLLSLVIVIISTNQNHAVEQNGTVFTSNGYEEIAAQLEHLKYKLVEIDLAMREDRELIDQKFSHQETFSAGMLWAINQLSQTIGQNLTEDREIIDQKLSGVSGAIGRLSQAIAHNLTDLQAQSDKLLAQQRACASHEQMRKEIQMIASNSVRAQLKRSSDSDPTSVPYRSCKEVPSKRSGTYLIQPTVGDEPFKGYCEQKTFGGGWLVFQFRHNGSVNFFRDWNSYRDGFGSVEGEFWLGLEKLHRLTSARPHELLLELKDFSGKYDYAWYSEFKIGNEIEQFPLTKLGSYTGTMKDDDLSRNKGMKFSTFDRDNDDSCASTRKGAWWYWGCTYLNLNGLYTDDNQGTSIYWSASGSGYKSMAYSRMMIRET